jgi:hypothetical protein
MTWETRPPAGPSISSLSSLDIAVVAVAVSLPPI